ncbi:hypothetical protein L6164_028962 [Bauhinia variegata]|uniref:Uncharacterized protein n=1 Tax=Bauhinia variegata TaxID=167791 RepID=A0ACB9L776_BAUVA|nr:hypothetical protein L6164_028962 [Bauhinia variegata]
MKPLKIFNISGCSKALRQPENFEKSEGLEVLKLSRTSVKEVLPSIMHLKSPKRFSILFGWMLGRHHISSSIIVPPISCFSLLKELDLSYCDLSDESLPPEMGCLSSLIVLDVSGNNFTELPAGCVANLTNLRLLYLNSCAGLKSMPKLPLNIKWFTGLYCPSLVTWSDQECLPNFFATHSVDEQKKVQLPELDRISDSTTSIIEEIPDYCLSSEQWGIAVCLALENHGPASIWSLYIHIELPESTYATCTTYPGYTTGIMYSSHASEKSLEPYLCTFLIRSEYIHRSIRPHLKGDQNKLRVTFGAYDHLRFDKLRIRECGWRVIREEDLQVWWDKARSEREQDNGFGFDMPSTSSSSDLYKARVREIDDEWAKIPNDEDREL